MKKVKKILAICIAILILFISSSVWMYSVALQKEIDPNVLLLETLKKEKPWVIESLVDNNFNNNPYTELCGGLSQGFMDSILQNYEQDTCYKLLVDAMDKYRHKEEYVTSWTQEGIASLIAGLGLVDEQGVKNYVATHVKSVDNLQFEDIINEVLMENYTSSWGSSLLESNSSLEEYRQMAQILKNLSNYQKALQDNSKILSNGYFESEQEFMEYTDHFLSAYEDALYDTLLTLPHCGRFADDEGAKKALGASALAFVLGAELYDPLPFIPKENQDTDTSLYEIYDYFFAPEINAFLKASGKALEVGSIATEYAMLLETLMSQKESTVQVMNRIKNTTTNVDLQNTLIMYADLIEDQGNTQALAYDVIVDYLSKQDKIGKDILQGSGKLFTKFLNSRYGYFDGNKMVMTNAISENLWKAGKCTHIAMWVADKATNIQETSKKIYICKFLKIILDQAIKTYKADYKAYAASQTDENARKVLDDLEFIKRLRLYGEMQGYKTVCSQSDSIIGLLCGGGVLREDLDKMYQGQVDSLLGCTLSPTSNLEITVNEGEILTVMPWKLANGKYTMYGCIDKPDGSKREFAEADIILMGSLKLNGGTINFVNRENVMPTPPSLFLSTLEVTKTSKINIRHSDVNIGLLKNTGNLTITTLDSGAGLKVSDKIENTGEMTVSTLGQSLSVKSFENTGSFSGENCSVDIYGPFYNNGSTDAKINICGVEPGGTTEFYKNAYEEKGIQTVSGHGSNTSLYISNSTREGVLIEGEQEVSKYFCNVKSRVRKGENIILTGTCTTYQNYIPHNITLKDITVATPLTTKGRTRIRGNVILNGVSQFREELELQSDCVALTLNGSTDVVGDMFYAGGKVLGEESLKLHGNLIATCSAPEIQKLDFVGKQTQKVESSNSLHVVQLNNHNTSFGGVDFKAKLYVHDRLLTDANAKFVNGQNVFLQGNAKVSGIVRSRISSEDWTVSDDVTIQGVLLTNGTTNITNTGHLNTEATKLNGTITNAGTISVNGDCELTGTLTGGTLQVKGDLFSTGALKPENLIFTSKMPQEFHNTAETTVQNLTVENLSQGGFTVNSVINVLNTYNANRKPLVHGENIVLKGNAKVSGIVRGRISSEDWTVSDAPTIQGMLFTRGTTNILNTGHLNTEAIKLNGTITNAGTISVNGDCELTGTLTGGTLQVKGDLFSTGALKPEHLIFTSKMPQNFSNTAETTVQNLTIKNSSKGGFAVNSVIQVSNAYTAVCNHLIHGENIVLQGDAFKVENGVINSDVALRGAYTVKEGDILQINGKLTLKHGATLTVENGAKLILQRSTEVQNGSIFVAKGGELILQDYLKSDGGTYTVDGTMVIKGDCMMQNATVNAAGLITFKSDLNISGGTWNNPNIAFISGLPQIVSGSNINVGNLTVDNLSKSGIQIQNTITPHGTVEYIHTSAEEQGAKVA